MKMITGIKQVSNVYKKADADTPPYKNYNDWEHIGLVYFESDRLPFSDSLLSSGTVTMDYNANPHEGFPFELVLR